MPFLRGFGFSVMVALFVFIFLVSFSCKTFAEGGWAAERDTGCEAWIPGDAELIMYFRATVTEHKRSFSWNGACRNGKLDGQGVMQVFEGSLIKTYQGPFANGYQSGKGVLTWFPGASNQIRYEGDFLNGRKQGLGVQVWQKSGMRYEGEWKNDKRNGKGVTTWPSGKIEQGRYQDDVYLGP